MSDKPMLTRAQMEERRMKAAELFAAGVQQSKVGHQLQVTRQTVSRWHDTWITKGAGGLARRKGPGRPPRLRIEERADELRALYNELDPLNHTAVGFAAAIKERFDVTYDPDHVNRIMHKLGVGKRIKSRRSVEASACR